jgi:hypothetical protein
MRPLRRHLCAREVSHIWLGCSDYAYAFSRLRPSGMRSIQMPSRTAMFWPSFQAMDTLAWLNEEDRSEISQQPWDNLTPASFSLFPTSGRYGAKYPEISRINCVSCEA